MLKPGIGLLGRRGDDARAVVAGQGCLAVAESGLQLVQRWAVGILPHQELRIGQAQVAGAHLVEELRVVGLVAGSEAPNHVVERHGVGGRRRPAGKLGRDVDQGGLVLRGDAVVVHDTEAEVRHTRPTGLGDLAEVLLGHGVGLLHGRLVLGDGTGSLVDPRLVGRALQKGVKAGHVLADDVVVLPAV